MPPHLWHGHELIFGFGAAALGGFFLTAVPNWTGAKGAARSFIEIAAAIWLLGRLAMWFSGALPPLLVAAADLAFLPLLGAQDRHPADPAAETAEHDVPRAACPGLDGQPRRAIWNGPG